MIDDWTGFALPKTGKKKKARKNRSAFHKLVVDIDQKCMNRECMSIKKRVIEWLQVHHIIYISQGGEDIIENGITLCPACHRLVHEGGKDDTGHRLTGAQWMRRILKQWEGEPEYRWGKVAPIIELKAKKEVA